MKKYNITVNGVTYEVAVEEISEGAPVSASPVPAVSASSVKTEVATPAPVTTPTPAAAPVATSSGGETVNAPMPGTILKMLVGIGDKVEKDSLVCILEAMKMENEIFSPVSGTVTAINAAQGATVSTGDVIITLG